MVIDRARDLRCIAQLGMLVGALFAAISFVPIQAHAADLTVATFNAEFLTKPRVHMRFGLRLFQSQWTDAQRAQWTDAFREQKFAESVAAVAPVIAAIDADVIALVEVGDETDVAQLNQAVANAGVNYPHTFVCDCRDGTTQQHVAVLSKIPLENPIDLIPGREGFYAEEDDAESEDDTGLSKSLKVEFVFDGERFHLFVLHLKSERGFSESDGQRVAQASIVRRTYLPLLQRGGHIIVAGDLNDGRGQPTLKRIRGFDDIWPDLIQTGNTDFFEETEYGERWTHEFEGVRNQIDHILLSPSIKELASIAARVHPLNDQNVSDHRPFVVTLGF